MACISQVSHIDMTALVRERSLGVVLLRGWRCLSGPTVSRSWKSHSPGLTERLSVFLPGTFFWDCQQYFRGNVISASPAELELTPAWVQAVPSRDSWCGCRWNLRPLEGTAGSLFHQHQSLEQPSPASTLEDYCSSDHLGLPCKSQNKGSFDLGCNSAHR